MSEEQIPTPHTGGSGRSSARSRTYFACREQLIDAAEYKLGRHTGCKVPFDKELLAALKAWRLETTNATSQPAFMIFTDTTLQTIVEVEPVDRVQLLQISGIGAVKADRFGVDVLWIVAEYGTRGVDPARE